MAKLVICDKVICLTLAKWEGKPYPYIQTCHPEFISGSPGGIMGKKALGV
jgi:hypothetical protein